MAFTLTKRRVRRGAVATALATALVTGVAPEAATAHAPWPHNGCTGVPSEWSGVFNFRHACDHHDGCYVQHWGSRATCDWWFLNDMLNWCYGNTGAWTWQRATCASTASVYYYGVRRLGAWHYYVFAPTNIAT